MTDDQKHTPNTTEYSYPHTSAAEPKEHVDSHAYGSDGKREPEHETHHITDEGHINIGREHQKTDEENKKSRRL